MLMQMGPLNLHNADLKLTAGAPAQLLKSGRPQIAFSGRSNVGKSSLVNCLLGRKKLARVSGEPGKTITVNYYDIDSRLFFVDLPGYGYAKKSQSERQRWADMIFGYYEQERSFNLVIVLVDIRLEMQKLDKQMVDFLREKELPFIIALTKADKLSKSKQHSSAMKLANQFGVERDQMIITSSKTGVGMDELKKRIEAAVL